MSKRIQYTLEELFAKMTLSDPEERPLTPEEKEWLEAPPVGEEVGSGQDDESVPTRDSVGKTKG
ncbi:hypothetical protein RY831_32180 [Noviherbaspirillum sp. CPCC 100848]|uniref:Transcriptional regulator n=1 Tax=Noviherbaspirillum album TaxID=3080276 RepID=A0ABU6JJS0_9BURK|nr:hypothetical protein [Noviherbaspirillum sp. CPCC 100848]MEC4723780.1 hypothetical protein [Noviherbaspirillum sp. CPCC 100848]